MCLRRPDFDLTEPANAARLIRQQRPDLVVHLAVQAGVEPRSDALYQNLIMGGHLIEACYRGEVGKFVQVGRAGHLAHESLFMLVEGYQFRHGFGGVNLRLDDLYGPGDDFGPKTSSIIPALILKCSEGRDRGHKAVESSARDTRPNPDFT